MSEITNFRGEAKPASDRDDADTSVARLITRVGDRVRRARERKGISRRILSEQSGVSPRYLAQLESGAGNISIGLLQRVAIALDHRIEWLTGEEDPWTSDALRIGDLYRSSNADTQRMVQDLLSPEPEANMRAGRICLVGLRGAGKSTLGALAGQALDLPFVELNSEIESQSGMPVDEVMALYGQEGYRKLEAQAISRIAATHDSLILAAAGGVVGEPETYNSLLSGFHTIWIKASAEDHMARVRAQGDERPMAGNPEAMEQLRSILASREALYGKALAQLDTSGQGVDDTVSDLVNLIRDREFLG
ncbi:helix-turn-helix domain-containing protein [Parasedimentitalea marina]|uniref:Shikimate kinase n=1 Tax=Parasedimentitalea marina TaxID=2483033 RepID=A0A3T0N7I9_9RHOB|nr:helix-turn-helix transcriptional regulator [Parasedimentitalea marina]AZV79922.1 helix-turn-helix domain-containing protein [Parasedimentitalea marina]